MTDKEWNEVRERWRAKCQDGDLRCGPDMIPTVITNGVPWGWLSRQQIEELDK